MRLPAQSLFLKIFLWFWATAIATSISLILTFIFGSGSVPARWHSTLTDTARSSGMVAIAEYEKGGSPAATAYLARFEHDTQLRACLFAPGGSVVAGIHCGSFAELQSQIALTHKSEVEVRYGLVRVALTLPGPNGEEFIFATELPAGPRAALGTTLATVLERGGVAFLVSGFICYLLAHYLTAPILQLQIAARQLAAGRLSTRAVLSLRWRKDEIGDLVQDFNEMAERMEELVSRQRQLIYDISHELRSPLARLNVALDLGRQRKGSDPAFDRMERDIDCLNEMIGRLLTLARLDAAAAPVEMSSVDMTELVAQIVHDAGFESKKRNVIVRLTADEDCVVQGNAGLLHSAIENVVRNAVLYTVPDSAVEVVLEHSKTGDTDCINLSILDQGPGVAESDLERIFRPFYRTTEARDRASGGAGLGLAIADRVIHTHGGTIRARNTNGKGLEVRISLPSLRGLT